MYSGTSFSDEFHVPAEEQPIVQFGIAKVR